MTENTSVGYVNIRDAPPDYRSTSDTASANEPLIMIPIRKEIRQVEERQHRNRALKRRIFCFSVGFVSWLLAVFIGVFIWKNYGEMVFQTVNQRREISQIFRVWIDSISSFILENHLDGVELYYRWPKSKEDKDNYVFLARELRYKLQSIERITRRQTPYIISVLASPFNWNAKGESLIFDLSPSVDFFNVETENFNAPWHGTGQASPFSPLYSSNQESIDFTMKAYVCTTKLPNRFNFIVPFRGAFWKNVERPSKDDEHYKSVGMKNDSEEWVAWREFKKGWNISSAIWDDVSRTPYILDLINRTLLTFENERSLREKMEYVVSKNLGGITIDRVDWDDDSNTLLNALTSVDVCSGPKFKNNEINYKLTDRNRTKSIWVFGFILLTILAAISYVLTIGVFKLVDVLSSAETEKHRNHIDSISSFIHKHYLDGVELFYKWPESKEDKESFVFFVRELRYELENMERISSRNSSYVLSIVAPRQMEESESIIFHLLSSVDFFNVETNNYNLPWHKTGITGPPSPLYSKNNESIDATMKAYTCIAKLPSKFNFVVPFRGVFWKNVKDSSTDDEQYRTVSIKNDSGLRISFKKEWDSTRANWDDVSKTPYIWDPKYRTLLTFENERSMKAKIEYVVSNNLGGITIDSLEWDDDSNTLLNALTSVDLCPKRKNKQDKIEYDCG
ncbi:hypothetical protein CAEBREN_24459 [Caenorhabditis brenneri]|uniref:GH18 domain-containing protein n=1 Tax=Caenorhabditis brenneri TaxID=135651 RepID=G0NN55_CAEBE|nr:hypothetical protein CAEBREN_24459 [Caenorhabditis brenneri]